MHAVQRQSTCMYELTTGGILSIERSLITFTLLSSELCNPAIPKINACCLTFAISYFVLSSQPFLVPCLFEEGYWKASVYFQNHCLNSSRVKLKEVQKQFETNSVSHKLNFF